MNTILINKNKKFYLDNNYTFIVREGKVTTRNITANGKVTVCEICLKKGDLILNYFEFFKKNELASKSEIDLEIEALEDTILEKISISSKDILNQYYLKILDQLTNKTTLDFLYQIYPTKGYILSQLKLYGNENGIIVKKEVKVEDFNIGKTQFYKNYSELLNDKYLIEKEGKIYLNLKKINEYLLEIEK